MRARLDAFCCLVLLCARKYRQTFFGWNKEKSISHPLIAIHQLNPFKQGPTPGLLTLLPDLGWFQVTGLPLKQVGGSLFLDSPNRTCNMLRFRRIEGDGGLQVGDCKGTAAGFW